MNSETMGSLGEGDRWFLSVSLGTRDKILSSKGLSSIVFRTFRTLLAVLHVFVFVSLIGPGAMWRRIKFHKDRVIRLRA